MMRLSLFAALALTLVLASALPPSHHAGPARLVLHMPPAGAGVTEL